MGERTIISPAIKLRRPASPLPRVRGWIESRPPWLQKLGGFLHAAGGWRQVAFALGLAFVLGGIGDRLDCAVMLFIGGLLIGIALRIPWLKG